MLNRIVLMGRLTKDPDLKYAKDTAICKLTIATSNPYSKDTLFIDATAFGKRAEKINEFFKKGRLIVIEGKLSMSEWVDKEGKKKRKHEIIIDNFYFADSKPKDEKEENSKKNEYGEYNEEYVENESDEIPF